MMRNPAVFFKRGDNACSEIIQHTFPPVSKIFSCLTLLPKVATYGVCLFGFGEEPTYSCSVGSLPSERHPLSSFRDPDLALCFLARWHYLSPRVC